MKTKILLFFALYLVGISNLSSNSAVASNSPQNENSINVLCTPDLHNLATSWAKEYNILNPKVKISVIDLNESQIVNSINTPGNLCFISNEYYSQATKIDTWKMVVGMDAIVPIISSKNPLLNELNQNGVSADKIAQFIGNPTMQNWETLVKGQKKATTYYTINNESINSEIASFLGIDKKMVSGTKVANSQELILAIEKDPYAIGFCKVSSIVNGASQNLAEGIRILPIDKNGNGRLDSNERIYEDLNSFLRGVWIGKYPKDLCKNIYSLSSTKPTSESEVAFLAWVITNGQQYLNPNGFSNLASNQRQANIDKLYEKEVITKSSSNRSALPIAILIIVACVIVFIVVDSSTQRLRKTISKATTSNASPFFNESSIEVPDGLYFDKSHTWAFMEKNGLVGIGIDDFLQHVTGPITKIKMKESGEKVKKGEAFLTIIQDGKQLNLKSPVSGTIKSQNKNLISNSALINQSPYNEGWIYTVEPSNWIRDTQFLIFANGYNEWLKMEFLHLKDFLAVALRPNNAELVLQDGGEIKNGILKDLKPEIWEDFQTHFLDSSL